MPLGLSIIDLSKNTFVNAEVLDVPRKKLENPKHYFKLPYFWLYEDVPVIFASSFDESRRPGERLTYFSTRPYASGHTPPNSPVIDNYSLRIEHKIYDDDNSRPLAGLIINDLVNPVRFGGFEVRNSQDRIVRLGITIISQQVAAELQAAA